MERSAFSQALQSKEVLSAQSKQEWDALQEQYPYAALLQLMHAQRKDSLTQTERRKLLIYADNPLHLSVLLSNKKAKASTSKKGAAETEKASQKKTSRLVNNAPTIKEEIETTKQPIEEKVVAEPIEKNIARSHKVESVNEKGEDVLQLIQDLPEENLIPQAERLHAEEASVASNTEIDAKEDPGDLMVMMSFTDWLQYFKTKKENEAEDQKGRDAIRSAWQKEKLAEAMDDDEDVVPDDIFEKAMKSVSFGDGLVTEPLAELYAQQGKTEKAVELYKKLSLLNPEKKVYFASRIKELHLLK